MGPGSLPSVGLDHLLLLRVEGSEVHGQGENFLPLMFITWRMKTRISHFNVYIIPTSSFALHHCKYNTVAQLQEQTEMIFLFLLLGGLLHCYLSLFNVSSAAGARNHSPRSKKWDHILPLPRSSASHRPSGTEQFFSTVFLKMFLLKIF